MEEELLNSVLNQIATSLASSALKKETGIDVAIASPYRRYSIYDANRNLVGVSRKTEAIDTTLEIVSADERTLLARATKFVGDKLTTMVCKNPIWRVELFDTPGSPANDPRVVATIVAIKTKIDANAASQARWNAWGDLMNSVASIAASQPNEPTEPSMQN